MLRNNSKLFIGGLFLVLAGALGLALPFISFGLSEDYEILQKTARDFSQANYNDQFISAGTGKLAPIETIGPDPNLANIENRIIISKIGVNMPIFQSDSVNTLLKGGWIFPATSTPDRPGNTVLFGHRFRYLPPISNTFYALDNISVDDEFIVTWQGKTYTYRVEEKKIIEPTDFSVLRQTDKSEITLITCAPLFSTKQRLVVRAVLVGSE